jgi:hypothetical protein
MDAGWAVILFSLLALAVAFGLFGGFGKHTR